MAHRRQRVVLGRRAGAVGAVCCRAGRAQGRGGGCCGRVGVWVEGKEKAIELHGWYRHVDVNNTQ